MRGYCNGYRLQQGEQQQQQPAVVFPNAAVGCHHKHHDVDDDRVTVSIRGNDAGTTRQLITRDIGQRLWADDEEAVTAYQNYATKSTQRV